MLREHSADLVDAIVPCLHEVVIALQEKDLISLGLKFEILQRTGVYLVDKAMRLVTNLSFSLKCHPCPDKYLIDVAQVLHSQGNNALREIAIAIQQNLGKFDDNLLM